MLNLICSKSIFLNSVKLTGERVADHLSFMAAFLIERTGRLVQLQVFYVTMQIIRIIWNFHENDEEIDTN
ncbi:hypothetical protein D0466_01030 [Peribacillus glennii]|uniref:Uncharacterized protein n=1 Tax=Peribacillus glennii TaxID=2303991 RepID=A0A372LLR7_9BACI|nr:hypothetical protein D0466_01030 [Peribacillus glennii]